MARPKPLSPRSRDRPSSALANRYYEVEATMDDGRQIDVQLDEAFNVVGEEVDTADDKD